MSPEGFRLGGTSTDRAGGVLRLRNIAGDLVGREWSLEVVDTGAHFSLLVVGSDGYPIVELESVPIARSVSIRIDQVERIHEDKTELALLLEAEVDRQFASLPEPEKRALAGDR